jgi:aryl-alcohol dehydrogenase-like predicted oxidoreductase
MIPARELGDSGIEVSVLGLGCNNFGRRVDLAGTSGRSSAARWSAAWAGGRSS